MVVLRPLAYYASAHEGNPPRHTRHQGETACTACPPVIIASHLRGSSSLLSHYANPGFENRRGIVAWASMSTSPIRSIRSARSRALKSDDRGTNAEAAPTAERPNGCREPGSTDPDALLLNEFRRARRRFRGAIVGISARTTITNPSACELLGPTDRRALRQWMQTTEDVPDGSEVAFDLANGLTARARCYQVRMRRQRVGVVLHISVPAPADVRLVAVEGDGRIAGDGPSVEAAGVAAGLDPALLTGWAELTDSERAVAELVGRGRTNKDAARHLFMSRHTVDHHLRGVFSKLGISSRVELARLLGEHYESLAAAAPKGAVA